MNKSFYNFASFFLKLSAATGLFHGIVYLLLNTRIFTLSSFSNWFLVVTIVSLIIAIFLLKYYHFKKYRVTFFAALIASLGNLCLVVVIYLLMLGYREFESYRMPLLYFVSGAGLLYAISLVFSRAGERFWLKKAGIFMFILESVLLSRRVWHQHSQDTILKDTLEKLSQWTSLVVFLLPILYIMNFLSEEKSSETNGVSTSGKFSESFLGFLGVLLLLTTLFFGYRIATETYLIDHVPARVQLLAQQFEARAYVSSKGETLHYRLLKPLNYVPNQPYPLIVSLHGGAGWGTDNMRQVDEVEHLLTTEANRKKYPAFLFLPQIPHGTSWGGFSTLVARDSLVFEAIGELEQKFNIDVKRRYVMGHSLGGYGSWHFICARPEMFAAAMPFAGEGDPKLASKIVDVPVWAFHGRKDRAVPVSGSRDMIEAIKKAGGNPRYSEFPDAGHGSWKEVMDTPGVMDWLFAQKRE